MQNNLEKNVENYFVDVLKMLYLCSRAAKIGCVRHIRIKNLRVCFVLRSFALFLHSVTWSGCLKSASYVIFIAIRVVMMPDFVA